MEHNGYKTAVKSINTSDNLDIICNDIDYIVNNSNMLANPCIVFIGIGTCAGRVESNGILLEENYHQFPPALKTLYNKYKKLHIFGILIDPILEKDLHLTTDIELRKTLLEGEIFTRRMINEEVEMYSTNRLHFYTLRDSITINDSNNLKLDDLTNIIMNLRRIHSMCINNNIMYLYHDFTGKNIRNTYNIFKNEIKKHLNTIIYGFGNGYISGCYYDIRKPEAQLAHVMCYEKPRPYLSIYNIDTITFYPNNNFSNFFIKMVDKYGDSMVYIIEAINTSMIENFKFEFNNYIYGYLRYAFMFVQKLNEHKDIIESDRLIHSFYPLNDIDSKILEELFRNNSINVFNKMKDIIASYYDTIIKIILLQHSDMGISISTRDIIENITSDHKNIYNWGTAFNQIFLS